MCFRSQGVGAAWRLFISIAVLLAAARAAGADLPLGSQSSTQPPPQPPPQTTPQPSPQNSPRWIVVRLSATLFKPLIEQPIDETLPVDDMILATHVVGQAHVQGRPQVILVDDAHSAALTVSLAGTIHSRTIGRKGPVTIFGGSETRFTASTRVVFDPSRGFVAEPAKIDVETNVSTERIEAGRGGPLGRTIERLAWSQVVASRALVTAIVREKTERQIRAEFDRLMDERLARVNRAASFRHVVELALGGGDQVRYICSTSERGLEIAAIVVEPNSAELPGDLPFSLAMQRPAPAASMLPVQIWIDQSMVSGGAALTLRWLDLGRRPANEDKSNY